MSSKIRCAAAALALLLLLSAGTAHARPAGAVRMPAVSFEGFWQWVASGWASLWAKAGSEMDPDGVPRKAGGEMDPDGLVYPLPPAKAGGDMDPNG